MTRYWLYGPFSSGIIELPPLPDGGIDWGAFC